MSIPDPCAKPDSLTDADPEFADLQRRFLVLVNQFRLIAENFGDISWVPEEHSAAAFLFPIAAEELDAIYDRIDAWYVHHEHIAKGVQP